MKFENSDPPNLSRASSSSVAWPLFAQSRAAVTPANPPPTTITSMSPDRALVGLERSACARERPDASAAAAADAWPTKCLRLMDPHLHDLRYVKWHLGRTEGRFPTDQGFDEWYGTPNSTDESTYSSLKRFEGSGVSETHVLESVRGELPKQVRPYRLDYGARIDGDLTDRAIRFIARQAKAGKPFFG